MHLWNILFPAAAAAAAIAGIVYMIVRRSRNETGDRRSLLLRSLAALAAGLILFLILESGLERRIGPDLFLPVRDGALMPQRVICFFASLFIGFVFAFTEAGRKASGWIDRLCSRDPGRFAAAGAVAALFFLWTWRLTDITFLTNDDVTLIRQFADIPEKGLSSAVGAFSSIFFCALFGWLYGLSQNVLWYTIYEIAVLFISCTILGRCILLKAGKRGFSAPAGLFLHLLACGAVFFYPFGNLSFTVTPALVGSAAAALVFCRGDLDTRRARCFSDIAVCVLVLFCCLQRAKTGLCVLCFIALAAVYQAVRTFLSGRPGRFRQILCILLLVCAAFALYHVPNNVLPRHLTLVTQADTVDPLVQYYRVNVTDYLMPVLTDEQFEAAGIPAELACLLRGWFFMDERLNLSTFQAVTHMYKSPLTATTGSILSHSRSIPDTFRFMLTDQTSGLLYAATVLSLLVLLAIAFLRLFRYGKHSLPEFLCSLCAVGGYVLLQLYLLLQGRFPYRVYLVIFTPAFFLLILSALTVPEKAEPKRTRWPAVTARILLVVLVFSVFTIVYASPRAAEYTDRYTLFSEQIESEAYANDHPDTRLITNLTANNLDPFHPTVYPSNLIHWSGPDRSLIQEGDPLSPFFQDKGFWDASTFFEDDVLFLYGPSSALISLLFYLSLDYGPVQGTVVTPLTDFASIADLSQVTPGENYTGWYEQNGLTYYFENGEAVTGTHVIDGVEYEFAPAGNEASLVILPGENIVYSTNAYSLVTAP